MKKTVFLLFFSALCSHHSFSQNTGEFQRQHLLMDFGWRFAFGHPYIPEKDFNNGTGYFSYFAKAGYGDGAAAGDFDDRSWRLLDLPHDWAVEQPFDSTASFSHGFKAIGRNFPASSVGWYRKSFPIPASALGRRISIGFDGVFRNSTVWLNGHYLGTEIGGYLGFEYDITDYLNYGGNNEVAVRVDATMEEGWFYEGAGIYRHVWLNLTNPLHVITNGTAVTTDVTGRLARINTTATVDNHCAQPAVFDLEQTIVDSAGQVVARDLQKNIAGHAYETRDIHSTLTITAPICWDLERPYLYKLVTTLLRNNSLVDTYSTNFGIRTIQFDANKGFFLNGKHVEIKGTDNHQDHAGVGTAIPDALQDFRIATLKSLGSNAYRCSHNPPTPELLDACDRLGMVVIDENRLMGTTQYHLDGLKKLITRDRNHPSVISWSIGNEEWAIENTVTGARIAAAMQDFVKTLDTSRPVTLAFSGGVGNGNSTTVELLGFNYVVNKNTDAQHQKYPQQLSWGTEEGSTVATRGVYFDDPAHHYREAYDEPQHPNNYLSIEQGWTYYSKRDYLAGMYIWTGFDYRGEPTPFGWPSVVSLFGMFDLCGFPKDDAWYLKSWWTDQPTIHVLPHWNWPGKEGKMIRVWVYSNCREVALFLNGKNLGKKVMTRNSHLEWNVPYTPGTLVAVGYNKGHSAVSDTVQTTGEPDAIRLVPRKNTIQADKEDLALLTVEVLDNNNRHVPTADDEITLHIEGPAVIIGVGNGNPTSLENEKYVPIIDLIKIDNLKEKYAADLSPSPETAADYDDRNWMPSFQEERTQEFGQRVKAIIYRGSFVLPPLKGTESIHFFYKNLGKDQIIFINGQPIPAESNTGIKGNSFFLTPRDVHAGLNAIAIVTTPLLKMHPWDVVNQDPGVIQVITPAAPWKRRLFNGLAQVIVQATGQPGVITITATSGRLKRASVQIQSIPSAPRPSVPE